MTTTALLLPSSYYYFLDIFHPFFLVRPTGLGSADGVNDVYNGGVRHNSGPAANISLL